MAGKRAVTDQVNRVGTSRANWSARLLGVTIVALLIGVAGLAAWLYLGDTPDEPTTLAMPRVEMPMPMATRSTSDGGDTQTRSAALTQRVASANDAGTKADAEPADGEDQSGDTAATASADTAAQAAAAEETTTPEADKDGRAEKAVAEALDAIGAETEAAASDNADENTTARPEAKPADNAANAAGPIGTSGTDEVVLADAPDPALVETSQLGPLPVIGPRGREPWKVYARPFDPAETRPRVALVISDLGFNTKATEQAIALPGAVTLAFNPYAPRLAEWVEKARAAGHEVLLEIPMEPVSYPRDDPGPHTLRTDLDADTNIQRLHWALSRATGYVGVINHMGSQFTRSPKALRPVMQELKRRGLLFLDSRSGPNSLAADIATEVGVPRSINNRFLDEIAARDAINRRLTQIEGIAAKGGTAVGVGHTFPVTLDRVAEWIKTLDDKGLVLAPVSATVNRQVSQ